MAARVLTSLWPSSEHGRLPVVVDASSCTEGLAELVASRPGFDGLRVVDAVSFTRSHLLPRLEVRVRLASLTVHPTCSSSRLEVNEDLLALARAIADEVVVPTDWGCCAFAGDRGLLHPELTASATARQAAQVVARPTDAYASLNRTCEIGMTRATGQPYRHVLELLLEACRKP
jgi:D-lactate dehydrogenase